MVTLPVCLQRVNVCNNKNVRCREREVGEMRWPWVYRETRGPQQTQREEEIRKPGFPYNSLPYLSFSRTEVSVTLREYRFDQFHRLCVGRGKLTGSAQMFVNPASGYSIPWTLMFCFPVSGSNLVPLQCEAYALPPRQLHVYYSFLHSLTWKTVSSVSQGSSGSFAMCALFHNRFLC